MALRLAAMPDDSHLGFNKDTFDRIWGHMERGLNTTAVGLGAHAIMHGMVYIIDYMQVITNGPVLEPKPNEFATANLFCDVRSLVHT